MVRSKKQKVVSAEKSAAIALEKRARADLVVLEITKQYQASLEMAAKKCHEALKHIESVAFGHEDMPPMLAEAKKAAILAIQLIVRAAISDQRKKSYVTKKDVAARENLISQRKKLEDDNFQCYKRAYDDSDAGRESASGQRSEHESYVE